MFLQSLLSISHILFVPVISNEHGTCIHSPSPKLTSLPVINCILHNCLHEGNKILYSRIFRFYQKVNGTKYSRMDQVKFVNFLKTVSTNFTWSILEYFVSNDSTQTAYLTATLFGAISVMSCSLMTGFHKPFYA